MKSFDTFSGSDVLHVTTGTPILNVAALLNELGH